MEEYPIKEIVIRKTYETTIFVRANSDSEALDKAYALAIEGKSEEKFTDEPYYDTEKWSAYKEDIINDDLIIE